MKNAFSLILISLVAFIFSSCVNFYPFTAKGVFESEDAKMRVYFESERPSYKFGYDGEITNEDGTITKIVFQLNHGFFSVSKLCEHGDYCIPESDDVLFTGDARPKGENTLILKLKDGTKKVLKKVSKISVSSNSDISSK